MEEGGGDEHDVGPPPDHGRGNRRRIIRNLEAWTRRFYVTKDNHRGVRRLPGSFWTLYWYVFPPGFVLESLPEEIRANLCTIDEICHMIENTPYLLECDVNGGSAAMFDDDDDDGGGRGRVVLPIESAWEFMSGEEWDRVCATLRAHHGETCCSLKIQGTVSTDQIGRMSDRQVMNLIGSVPHLKRLSCFDLGDNCRRTLDKLRSLGCLEELHFQNCRFDEARSSTLAEALSNLNLKEFSMEKICFGTYADWLRIYDSLKRMDSLQVVVLGSIFVADDYSSSTERKKNEQEETEEHASFRERLRREGIINDERAADADFSAVASQHLEHHIRLHRVDWDEIRREDSNTESDSAELSKWVEALIDVSDQFDCALELIRARPELYAGSALDRIRQRNPQSSFGSFAAVAAPAAAKDYPDDESEPEQQPSQAVWSWLWNKFSVASVSPKLNSNAERLWRQLVRGDDSPVKGDSECQQESPSRDVDLVYDEISDEEDLCLEEDGFYGMDDEWNEGDEESLEGTDTLEDESCTSSGDDTEDDFSDAHSSFED